MATAGEHIAAIYTRLDQLEARVAELEAGDDLDQEIDLPLPEPTLTEPPEGAPRDRDGTDDDDLADLAPDERAAVIAARQRLSNETGGVLEDPIPEGQRARSNGGEVELPPASEEQREQRRLLAQAIGLADDFGQEGVEAYVKGGPLWLYYGNREYVLGLGSHVWTAMVEDVSQHSPQEAYEMGRDLFKARGNDVIREIPGWGRG